MIYDMIIIGGGPAGMSAALYASRQNLKFLMIAKQIGGLTNLVPTLKAYLGYPYITGFDLVEKFKSHLKEFNVPVREDIVTEIRRKGKLCIVKTTRNSYATKTLIIATGRRFKRLGIPGEHRLDGKGVSDCTVCDGPMFKGKTVAVIGGGRTGLFATLFLLKIAKKIYLIEKDKHLKEESGMKQFADILRKNKKVHIMTETKPLDISGDKFVKDIVLSRRGKKQIVPLEGVFVEIGYVPNTEFVKGFVHQNSRGEIVIDEECRTNVPGVFAAGDVTSLKEKQVVVSAGEGAKATLSAVLYLEKGK